MRNFKNGDRITITHPEHPACGKSGTVVRLRMADKGAWVNMDDDLPMDLRAFPKEDPRANHMMLYPDECTEQS